MVPIRRWFLIGTVSAFGAIGALNGWLSDDAYITLRTVDNFIHGYGLRWNVAERVQAYTHPLWLFVLAGPYAISREPYYTTLAVSLIVSMASVAVIVGSAASPQTGVLAAVMLSASKAFVDFSTSGLENPLSHLLLALFFVVLWKARHSDRALHLSLLASLCLITRPDLGLIVLPPLAVVLLQQPRVKAVRALALGFAPCLAWLLFSLLYYGFLFPNTAYAKLRTGVPESLLAGQGMYYLFDSLQLDFVTMPVILAGLLVPGARDGLPNWSVRLGLILYLVYVVAIGGDFMSGRFLTAVLVVAVMRIERSLPPMPSRYALGLVAVIIAAAGASPHPTFLGNRTYAWGEPLNKASRPRGINDERRFYWQRTGLFSPGRAAAQPRWGEDGLAAREEGARVVRRRNVGLYGFYIGPDAYVVDPYGLADPLLARLPPVPNWRIGHYQRLMPYGYVESLESGRNVIRDQGVRLYYDRLSVLTRDPLWSIGRLREIIRFNVGMYEPLLDGYRRALAAGVDVGVQ